VIAEPLVWELLPIYSIILALCAAAGLGLSAWLAEDRKRLLVEAGMGILFVSLLGARASYIIRNYQYFFDHAGQIPQIWLGGLSWPGALIGAGAGLWGVHRILKDQIGELADRLLPLFGFLVVAIWITGWGLGIGYGSLTAAWFGIPVKDIFGLKDYRWPLQIIGGILSGVWIAGSILFPIKRTREPGFRAVIGLAGVIGINGLISLFRVDPAPRLVGLRWETWISLIILGVIAGIYGLKRIKADDGKVKTK
jgi:prolipoprotein diacylglyceryltransferase